MLETTEYDPIIFAILSWFIWMFNKNNNIKMMLTVNSCAKTAKEIIMSLSNFLFIDTPPAISSDEEILAGIYVRIYVQVRINL